MSLKVLTTKKALQTHLQTAINKSYPVLLITSEPAQDEFGSSNKAVETFVNFSKFTIRVQYGLKNIHVKHTSAYPTARCVDEAVAMAKRGGATTQIIGVGSGAAIDCAKAVSSILSTGDNSDNPCHKQLRNQQHGRHKDMTDVELVLAPSTLAGIMASSSTSSLILDPHEEALIPLSCTSKITTVAVDSDQLTLLEAASAIEKRRDGRGGIGASVQEAALASLTICIDAAIHSAMNEDLENSSDIYSSHLSGHDADIILDVTANSLAHVLQTSNNCDDRILWKSHAVNAAIHSGQLLRYGEITDSQGVFMRSMPVALSSALLPKYFPHGNLLTFWAALCCGMCKAALDNKRTTPALTRLSHIITGNSNASCDDLYEWTERKFLESNAPTLAALTEGTPDIKEILNELNANQSLFGIDDGPLAFYMEEILHHSLNK